MEALGYNVQVNVGTVYVDANCPEGGDYFRSAPQPADGLVEGVVALAEREAHQMIPRVGMLGAGVAERRHRDRGHAALSGSSRAELVLSSIAQRPGSAHRKYVPKLSCTSKPRPSSALTQPVALGLQRLPQCAHPRLFGVQRLGHRGLKRRAADIAQILLGRPRARDEIRRAASPSDLPAGDS